MIVSSLAVSLSQDGRTGAVASGASVLLIDVDSGEAEVRPAPDTASVVALAPTQALVAVAGSEGTIARLTDGGTAVSLPGRLVLARVSDDGTVAALTRSDAAGTKLSVLNGDHLDHSVAPLGLGNVSAWGLELDGEHRTAMLWGLRGQRPWDGVGKAYICQVGWQDGGVEVTWTGAGLPADVELIRTGGGSMVALAGDRLVFSAIDKLVSRAVAGDRAITAPGTVHRLAMSPRGRFVAVTTLGDRPSRVLTARIEDEDLVDRGATPFDIDATAIAIDDDGRVALCCLGRGALFIAVANPGACVELRGRVEVPIRVGEYH